MLIFDGGEGGAHNTWEYLHIIDPEQAATGVMAGSRTDGPVPATTAGRPRNSRSDASMDWWIVLGAVALAALLAGVGLTWQRRARRDR